MTTLFRSMKTAEDGLPERRPHSRSLGARARIDIPLDAFGAVEPSVGGMSVSPHEVMVLPDHRRPPEHGGSGKDPVWFISDERLGPLLTYRPDPDMPDRHGFIEPSRRMSFDEYNEALYATADEWSLAEG